MPQDEEEEGDYLFEDTREIVLLKVYVLNEVLVGAIVFFETIYATFCGKLDKSPHLEEIEGAGFGIDEQEIA